MKTLVVTGLACPPNRWKQFLDFLPDAQIASFSDQLEGAKDPSDLRSLGNWVGAQIEALKPDLIIAHDFGVATSTIGLMKAKRKMPGYSPRVLLFNSALRGLNLVQTPHPIKVQVYSWRKIARLITESGGDCDPTLESHLKNVKAIYRQVILSALLDGAKSLLKRGLSKPIKTGAPVLVFVSDNDPYFPRETVLKMAQSFENAQVIEIPYGHFPYSVGSKLFSEHIRQWLSS